jgi:phenylalanyl-tRNA synthetase beta chain
MINWLKNLFGSRSQSQSKVSAKTFPGIIAAKVVKIEKHPNADRLRVITLTAGQREIAPVVCGAFNFNQGDLVALALPGAEIAQDIHSDTHEPFVLSKAKIRGIESQGMICAAFELGLSKEPGSGIMHLASDTPLGATFSSVMIKE